MGSLAQIDEFYHAPRDTTFTLGRFLVTDKQFRRPGALQQQLDTGLRAGIKLEYSGEFSPRIQDVINRIAELEKREASWDSYGGRPLNDRTVHPAFRLIIDGFKMCSHPRIQLNGAGELDLIWETKNRYLEVTAHADGTYDLSYEDSETGEEYETDAPVAFTVAQDYLARFSAIP
jgi:hypothetical protein